MSGFLANRISSAAQICLEAEGVTFALGTSVVRSLRQMAFTRSVLRGGTQAGGSLATDSYMPLY